MMQYLLLEDYGTPALRGGIEFDMLDDDHSSIGCPGYDLRLIHLKIPGCCVSE
jgi:hypothetical protein